jgi:predicted GIY-YIG superfamily endonuclease
MSDVRIKHAFIAIREGRSPEYVICDAILGEKFLLETRRLGFKGSDAEINTELINLRKQNRLKDCATTNRKKPDPTRKRYLNAVLNTVRLIERQFGKNVDNVICDPATRAQFDAMIQFMVPELHAFEARYAALTLRKTNRLQPEPVGQVIRTVGSKVLSLLDLESQLAKVPATRGVYIFFDEDVTLYAGKAMNLQDRIKDHVSTWSFREMIRHMRDRRRPQAFVVYHELPVEITARELAAYETELIRSRNPEHNRAGRTLGDNIE